MGTFRRLDGSLRRKRRGGGFGDMALTIAPLRRMVVSGFALER
jgi:hypothetical protein